MKLKYMLAAGMMAAITAARNGNQVILFEKNEKLGKKLFITGKGRCNITSSLPIEDFIQNVPGNGIFLYSSFNNFTNKDIIKMLEDKFSFINFIQNLPLNS